jgi:uncharacterized membrane protein YidH (DUF202 family)
MNRDPGLQPERTAMAWLRTQLLLFVISALVFRISEQNNLHWLTAISVITMLFSALSTQYVRKRFENIIVQSNLIGGLEVVIKKVLSFMVIILACVYLMLIWIR